MYTQVSLLLAESQASTNSNRPEFTLLFGLPRPSQPGAKVPKCPSLVAGWWWWLKPIWVLRGRAGSQEDTKGGVASVASALELATRKQVATSEGAAHAGKGVTWRKISLCTQQVSRLRDSCPLKMHPECCFRRKPTNWVMSQFKVDLTWNVDTAK